MQHIAQIRRLKLEKCKFYSNKSFQPWSSLWQMWSLLRVPLLQMDAFFMPLYMVSNWIISQASTSFIYVLYWVSLSLYVYVCAYECVHICVYTCSCSRAHRYMHTCMCGIQRRISESAHFTFWNRVRLVESQITHCWLAGEPLNPLVSPSQTLGLQVQVTMPGHWLEIYSHDV